MTDAIRREQVKHKDRAKKLAKYKYTLLERPTDERGRLMSGEKILMQSNSYQMCHDEMTRLNLLSHTNCVYSIYDRDLTRDFNNMMFGGPADTKKGTVRYGDS